MFDQELYRKNANCAFCGHPRELHSVETGICGFPPCSCKAFKTRDQFLEETRKRNEEYFDAERAKMTEFRITFGWGQPNGPGDPRFPGGFYTTVWAPSLQKVYSMAKCRYDGKYAFVYAPEKWEEWGPEMESCKELEVLQYYANSMIYPYPEQGMVNRGMHLGTGRE